MDKSMVQRLGQVLYWTGCAVAAVIVAATILLPLTIGGLAENWPALILALFVAAAAWALGRACRYVLTGH